MLTLTVNKVLTTKLIHPVNRYCKTKLILNTTITCDCPNVNDVLAGKTAGCKGILIEEGELLVAVKKVLQM